MALFPVPRGHLHPSPLSSSTLPLVGGGRLQQEGAAPGGSAGLCYNFTFYQKGSLGLFLALCVLEAILLWLTHPCTIFSSPGSH